MVESFKGCCAVSGSKFVVNYELSIYVHEAPLSDNDRENASFPSNVICNHH